MENAARARARQNAARARQNEIVRQQILLNDEAEKRSRMWGLALTPEGQTILDREEQQESLRAEEEEQERLRAQEEKQRIYNATAHERGRRTYVQYYGTNGVFHTIPMHSPRGGRRTRTRTRRHRKRRSSRKSN